MQWLRWPFEVYKHIFQTCYILTWCRLFQESSEEKKTTTKQQKQPWKSIIHLYVCTSIRKLFFFFACMLHWPAFFFRSSSQSCYVNHIFIKEGKATTEEKETVKKKRTGNKYSNPDNVIWSTPQISGEKKKERCIRHLTNIRDYNKHYIIPVVCANDKTPNWNVFMMGVFRPRVRKNRNFVVALFSTLILSGEITKMSSISR